MRMELAAQYYESSTEIDLFVYPKRHLKKVSHNFTIYINCNSYFSLLISCCSAHCLHRIAPQIYSFICSMSKIFYMLSSISSNSFQCFIVRSLFLYRKFSVTSIFLLSVLPSGCVASDTMLAQGCKPRPLNILSMAFGMNVPRNCQRVALLFNMLRFPLCKLKHFRIP